MDLSDKFIIILFFIVMAFNAVFIWMRLVLRKKRQEYSYVDRSWSVYHAYLDQMSRDRVLRRKFIRFVVVDCLILIAMSIVIFI